MFKSKIMEASGRKRDVFGAAPKRPQDDFGAATKRLRDDLGAAYNCTCFSFKYEDVLCTLSIVSGDDLGAAPKRLRDDFGAATKRLCTIRA